MKSCPFCSNYEDDNAVQCNVCGYIFQEEHFPQINQQYYQQISPQNYTQSSQSNYTRILFNLRKFQNHKEMQCLQCGYKGLVGEIGYRYSLGIRIAIYIGAVLAVILILYLSSIAGSCASGLPGGITSESCSKNLGGPLGFLFIISVIPSAHKKVYLCPNCERHIV